MTLRILLATSAAPEAWVAQPHRPYCGVKADVWSCGVLLYTLAFGLHPFEREDDAFYPDAEERVRVHLLSCCIQCKHSITPAAPT